MELPLELWVKIAECDKSLWFTLALVIKDVGEYMKNPCVKKKLMTLFPKECCVEYEDCRGNEYMEKFSVLPNGWLHGKYKCYIYENWKCWYPIYMECEFRENKICGALIKYAKIYSGRWIRKITHYENDVKNGLEVKYMYKGLLSGLAKYEETMYVNGEIVN